MVLKGWCFGMSYTVIQVAELTGLSKVSIYNKLKSSELKSHISKKQGTTYISESGLKIIKSGLKAFIDDEQKQSETAKNEPCEADLSFKDDYISYLKLENERLWEQVNHLSRLVENGQVLLKEKPQQDIQLLQDHCNQTDGKIIEARERMTEKQVDQQSRHKSLWDRILNRKNDC